MRRPEPTTVAARRRLRPPQLLPSLADAAGRDPGRSATSHSRRPQRKRSASRRLHGKCRSCSGGSTWPTRSSPSTTGGGISRVAHNALRGGPRPRCRPRTGRLRGQRPPSSASGAAGNDHNENVGWYNHVRPCTCQGIIPTGPVRARTGRPVDPSVQLDRDTRSQPCAWTMDSHGTGWLHVSNYLGRLICEAQRPPPPHDLPPRTYTGKRPERPKGSRGGGGGGGNRNQPPRRALGWWCDRCHNGRRAAPPPPPHPL